MDVEQAIEDLRAAAAREIRDARDAAALESLRARYLGRKGLLRKAMGGLTAIAPGDRPRAGQAANAAKTEIARLLEAAGEALGEALASPESAPRVDISLPGLPKSVGRLHPLTQTIESVKDIFARLGFQVVYGPEVELDYYNFEALNIPPDHPSRDAFDTFFVQTPVKDATDVLLRSQTSTVQVRVMEKRRPPIRIIAPGKVFRPDTVDASHSFLFHQIEGLMVDEDVTFADLKYVLMEFARGLFGEDVGMRFRPHFFPFTEPSAEVDIACVNCRGRGCSVCSRTGWLEILGSGMVDPNVFEAVGYDPEKYTGFAFGMGVERIAMLKHGIDDIRLFMANDLRFLRQF